MSTSATRPRLNIYLDDEDLRRQIKIAAARKGVTRSSYCLEAIRARLKVDAEPAITATVSAETQRRREAAALALDRLREQIGPIGVPVSDLIREGRRR